MTVLSNVCKDFSRLSCGLKEKSKVIGELMHKLFSELKGCYVNLIPTLVRKAQLRVSPYVKWGPSITLIFLEIGINTVSAYVRLT